MLSIICLLSLIELEDEVKKDILHIRSITLINVRYSGNQITLCWKERNLRSMSKAPLLVFRAQCNRATALLRPINFQYISLVNDMALPTKKVLIKAVEGPQLIYEIIPCAVYP